MPGGRSVVGASERVPEGNAEGWEIREQLDRILAHPHFRNSRRYPTFLRFIVERTLDGDSGCLKERTLGIDVFGRAADYDTNFDHVVRSTAAEVRKRLAQYYQEPEHNDEIRIELLPGSYIPHFRRPQSAVVLAAATEQRTAFGLVRQQWPLFLFGVSAALLILLFAFRSVESKPPETALDRFWAPALHTPAAVALCVADPKKAWAERKGQSSATIQLVPAPMRTLVTRSIPFDDAIALSRFAALFATKKKDYRLIYGPDSTLGDLRQGAAVVIGGVGNFWAVELTRSLPIGFVADGVTGRFVIEDREGKRVWQMATDSSRPNFGQDYALISRVADSTTGQLVVIGGGIQEYGTLAAAEFLTDAAALSELERMASAGWGRMNVQAVLSTKVLKRGQSRPQIVATRFW